MDYIEKNFNETSMSVNDTEEVEVETYDEEEEEEELTGESDEEEEKLVEEDEEEEEEEEEKEEEEELVETNINNETVTQINETEAKELMEQVDDDLDIDFIEKTFNESSLNENNTDVTD